MVAISLTMSICRGSDHPSSAPSLENQESICSSQSYPREPPAYGYHFARDNSLEGLVTKQINNQQRQRVTNLGANSRMRETGSVNGERKKSFGRGGVGNIRRPSDVIYPVKADADLRRRSSVWSTISVSVSPGMNPAWRRFSILGLLRRRSVHAEASSTERDEEAKIEVKEMDMGRRE